MYLSLEMKRIFSTEAFQAELNQAYNRIQDQVQKWNFIRHFHPKPVEFGLIMNINDRFRIIVSIEDYDLLKETISVNSGGYAQIKYETVYKIIIRRMGHVLRRDLHVDHINHDRLDNRRSNLRIVTINENGRNKTKKLNLTSQFYGVSKYGNGWAAKYQGKLRYFDSEHKAAYQRDCWILENLNDRTSPLNGVCEPFGFRHKYLLPKVIDIIPTKARFSYTESDEVITVKLKQGGEIVDILFDSDMLLKLIECRGLLSILGGYACVSLENNGKKTIKKLHRLVMDVTDSNIIVDHINRNPLDNRKANLRKCTTGENVRNKTKSVGKSSRYMGVSNSREKWRAIIKSEGVKISLGTFASEEEAALAYDNAARTYFGNFASLNFPNENKTVTRVNRIEGKTSMFKGVRKRGNKWIANFSGKYLGSFSVETEAAKTYDNYIITNNLKRKLNFPT